MNSVVALATSIDLFVIVIHGDVTKPTATSENEALNASGIHFITYTKCIATIDATSF